MNGELSPLDELQVVRRRHVVRPTETREHRSTLGEDLPHEEGGDKKGRWLPTEEGDR